MEVSSQGVIQQFLLPSSTSNGFFVLHKYPAEGRIQNLPFIVLLKCSRKPLQFFSSFWYKTEIIENVLVLWHWTS